MLMLDAKNISLSSVEFRSDLFSFVPTAGGVIAISCRKVITGILRLLANIYAKLAPTSECKEAAHSVTSAILECAVSLL